MNFLLENCDLLVRKFLIVNFNIKYTGYLAGYVTKSCYISSRTMTRFLAILKFKIVRDRSSIFCYATAIFGFYASSVI